MESLIAKERYQLASDKEELAKAKAKIKNPTSHESQLLNVDSPETFIPKPPSKPRPARVLSNEEKRAIHSKPADVPSITPATVKKLEQEKFELLKKGCTLDHPIIKQIDRQIYQHFTQSYSLPMQ